MKAMGINNTDEIMQAPDFVQAVVLASSVGQSFDTPAGAGFVVFSFSDNYWVRYGSTTAGLPSSSSTAGSSTSELNPTARNIGSTASCTGISISSPNAQVGSISWWKP